MDWRQRMDTAWGRVAISVAVLALTAAVSAPYIARQRVEGDMMLTGSAVGVLDNGVKVTTEWEATRTPVTEYEYGHYTTLVEVYADQYLYYSDVGLGSATRVDIGRAWLALRAHNGVSRREGQGQQPPSVYSVPAAAQALAAFPDLAAFVKTVGGRPVVADLRGMERALLRHAGEEVATARADMMREYPSFRGTQSVPLPKMTTGTP
jgi:hypothetical protein